MRQNLDLTYNSDLGISVNIASPSTSNGLVLRAYAYNANLLRFTVVNTAGVAVDLSSVTAWRLGFGNLGTGSPLVATADGDINQVADWASVNPAAGLLCAKLDLTTAELVADLGTKTQKLYYFDLQGDSSDGLSWQSIALLPLTCVNTVYSPPP